MKSKNSKPYWLYIDDIREPQETVFIMARSSQEAIKIMEQSGCPEFISFDYDLGDEDTAMLVVHWMIEKDLDLQGEFIPDNFQFHVHSANPVGAKNITGLLSGYLQLKPPPAF